MMDSLIKIMQDKQDWERRMLAFYTIIAISVTLIFSAAIAVYGSYGLSAMLVLLSLNNIPVLYFLKNRRDIHKSSYYLLSNSAICLIVANCFVAGLEGSGTAWVVILPLAGALLLKVRGLVFGTVLACGVFIIFHFRKYIPGVESIMVADENYRLIVEILLIPTIAAITFCFLRANDVTITDQTQKLDNLLNIVTHDIANPLTLISGYAELILRQEKADATHINALSKIVRASDLINDILRKVRHIQAAKAGKLQVTTTVVHLTEIFDKLRFIFEDRLRNKKQSLVLKMALRPDELGVHAEPVMLLNEVLSNLLSNAIKFSPSGSTIEIRVSRQGEFTKIEVRDQGIGIPADLLPYIFDDLHATNRSGTEGEEGTGFGLPLAQHLVQSFGGRLTAESQIAQGFRKSSGSVFILLLRSAGEDKLVTLAS